MNNRFVFTRCAVCDLDDCVPVAVGADFEYETSDDEFLAVQCRRCETVYLNPRPDDVGLRNAYPENYHAFQFNESDFGFVYRVRQRLEAKRLLRWCNNLRADAKILDIGCGDGFHIEILRKFGPKGWQVDGVDCDPRAAEGAKRRGIDIRLGMVDELQFEANSIDLILMIMTIEHVTDPCGLLTTAAGLLRPGGRIVVVTDNTGSPDFRIFGNRHWGGYHFPRHLYLFNRRNLSLLAERAGLKTLSVKAAVSPVNWTYSFRNWCYDWKGPRLLTRNLSLDSALALGLFTLVDIPLSFLGRGAILHGIFEKEALK